MLKAVVLKRGHKHKSSSRVSEACSSLDVILFFFIIPCMRHLASCSRVKELSTSGTKEDAYLMIIFLLISRGQCEHSGLLTPTPTSHPKHNPASGPACCLAGCLLCRRFKQRGLISIIVWVNTLITHLSNEAAVSQRFFPVWGIIMFFCACVSVRVYECV